MFNETYSGWNHSRIKSIIDHYGHHFFFGKKILDLGAGQGEIGAALARLGADVYCVDARQANLDYIKKRHPYLKIVKADLEIEWPFSHKFDIVLSIGLLCHLKNYEKHIKDICNIAETIILETEVLDSKDPELRIPIFEEKFSEDLAYSGEGSIVSSLNIEGKLSTYGATFKRLDHPKTNSGAYKYDWSENDSGRTFGNRRLWFIRLDNFVAQRLINQPLISLAENSIGTPAASPVSSQLEFLRGRITQKYVNNNLTPEQNNYFIHNGMRKIDHSNFTEPPRRAGVIRLFYNYYEDADPIRKQEIDFCRDKNINNKLFEMVSVESQQKPTYETFFKKINEISGPDDINIICNSDIFFDETIELAARMGPKDVYVLSRWDWKPDGSSTHRAIRNSQDTWIVRGKVENVNGDIELGRAWCDNKIAYEFNQAGYKVTNPSKSIKTYHVHNSEIRNYDVNENNIIPAKYLFVEVGELPRLQVFALTSMSPNPAQFKNQKDSIASWIAAGCSVVAFQSPEEINQFNPHDWPGVHFVPTEPSKHFRSFIPISRMARWAEGQSGHSIIINADCRLAPVPDLMHTLSNTSKDGLVYLIRYDVDGNGGIVKQTHGIDAFMFENRLAYLIPNSDILCMGKPWWDWVIPIAMLRGGKGVSSPSFPALFHTIHPMRWSTDDHRICSNEAVKLLNWRDQPHEMLNEIRRHTRNI